MNRAWARIEELKGAHGAIAKIEIGPEYRQRVHYTDSWIIEVWRESLTELGYGYAGSTHLV
ncbi:hypothetical protein LCGC14_1561020 [marine sediment metagenome]|uniref:Uncharacterized protein n=1 Tax=marine sediment metagenome TaxID=412755 RepID=A0A0F9IMG9_9ZZZZ